MVLIPLPAFADNYIWMVHDGHRAVVVDPGDAQPVMQALQQNGLRLDAILVTHHHEDHVGGVDELRDATGAIVYGPAGEDIPEPYEHLGGGDRVQVLGLDFSVLDVPGHTAGHIAYFHDPHGTTSLPPEGAQPAWDGPVPADPGMDGQPLLFCGDTLFSGGCGRLFEGTPAQMLASLDQLAALPGNTRVCCTHEYTLSNLRFARAVEPDNQPLRQYLTACEDKRARQLPTLPSSIALERAINPFLRSRQPAVIQAVRSFKPSVQEDTTVFAALREWKNQFK
jgi:hydroxyacylglutathione hydrolase